jgi:hypothetical protein
MSRFYFAIRWAFKHLLLSLMVASVSALLVFGLLYPVPYGQLLGITDIFWLILLIDVISGPMLTLILADPNKSYRERFVDLFFTGLIQLSALLYGLNIVWEARPAVLAFEVDRLVVITASEIRRSELALAPEELRELPWHGVMRVGTRKPVNSVELFQSLEFESAGVSPGMRPAWWLRWYEQIPEIKKSIKPLAEIIKRRPLDEAVLLAAAKKTGLEVERIFYLPLTSAHSLEWIVLVDKEVNIVGWANVDGF